MDPEERASALLELLSRRNTPTPVSELAAALRVSERTINYDLDALRRRGTVLKSIPGRNGGILLEQRRSTDPQPGAAGREPQDRFVGYERELDLLVSALPGNAQSGRVALISGDAGIGKTRLCEELAARAGEMGVGIMWGRCVDNEGAPPLWPWAQILRSLASSDSADTVLQDAQADAARIAAHVPELHALAPGARPKAPERDETDLNAERAQFLLFDSVATMLQQFAAQQPLLIILEDIQWADNSTLAVLQHLATRPSDSNATVVATHRPEIVESAVASTVSELRRSTGFIDIELQGLDSKGIERLISSVAGVTPSAESVDSIQKLTDGNPFFVREAVRWSGEGGPGNTASAGGLPPAVQEVVLSRLQPLGQDVLAVLETASILGREFELPRLIACLDTADRSQVLTALEAGIAHRVLNDVPDVPDLYRFEHEITRRALYHGIPAPRRSRLHAEVAERLEAYYGAAAVEHATELSHHSYQAGSAGEPERLKAWALAAGERALVTYSYEFAIEQFERVVGPGGAGNIDHADARALTGLGRALSQIREETKGVECLKKAFDFFMDTGRIDDAVEIAMIHLIGQEGQLATIQIKEAALDLLDQNSVEAARIMASLARPVGVHLGDYERASGLLNQALETAVGEGNAALEIRIADYGIHVAFFSQKWKESEEWCRRVLALANEIDDPFAVSNAEITLSVLRFGQGASAEAVERAQNGIQAAHATRNRERISSAYKIRQSLAIWMCDWDLARASAAESAQFWPDDPRAIAMSAATEFLTGHADEGTRILHRFSSLPVEQQFVESANLRWLPIIARCSGEQAHRDWTKSAAKRALNAPLESSNASQLTAGRMALAWMAVEESDQAAAAEMLNGIRASDYPDSRFGLRPALAHTAGLLDDAGAEFESLMETAADSGFTLAEAWLSYSYARFLTENPSLKGSRATRRAVNAGMRMADELGLTPLVARFEALADQLTDSDARPFGLSRREAEILGMIATGMPNQEIADSLILSRHTVVRHVANVFAKLDVNNRTEAAAIALEYEIGVEAK